jgi:hypothetical protein
MPDCTGTEFLANRLLLEKTTSEFSRTRLAVFRWFREVSQRRVSRGLAIVMMVLIMCCVLCHRRRIEKPATPSAIRRVLFGKKGEMLRFRVPSTSSNDGDPPVCTGSVRGRADGYPMNLSWFVVALKEKLRRRIPGFPMRRRMPHGSNYNNIIVV